MASPQIEDGYTKIANEIVEAIYQYPLSGHEFRMLLLIIRKTYGFNKLEDSVSLSQMMRALTLSKTRCSQVINKLQLQKIVTVTENINGIGKKYKFNKNFEQWITVHKNVNRYRKVKSTVTLLRNEPLQKSVSTKETITKETIQKKDTPEFVYPEWLPKQTFLEYQNSRKKKIKPESLNRFFKHLKKISDSSKVSPEEILNQSIVNGWEGIFPLKEIKNGNKGFSTNSYRGNNNDRKLTPGAEEELERIAENLRSKQ
jgi:phage replication O-like protein O